MTATLSLFETTFVSPHALALTSFLDVEGLGALAATSKACCDIALYQLNRYLEDFFPPIHPFTEDTHKVRSVLQQVEASVPSSAIDRSRIVGRRFFARFTREYPDYDFPTIDRQARRDKSFIRLTYQAWNGGLKLTVDKDASYYRSKACELGIEDLWNLVQRDTYACIPEEDLDLYDFPMPLGLHWLGSNIPHVRRFWYRQFPEDFPARFLTMNFEGQWLAAASMKMAILKKLYLKMAAIGAMSEKTTQQIIEKAALLREAVAGVLGVGILTGSIKQMFVVSSSTYFPPVLVYFTGLRDMGMEHSRFRDVPLLPISLRTLSLSGNPRLRGFAHLARLINLQNLDLSSCDLEAVPPEVCAMSHLQHLDLSDNGLVALPVELSRIFGDIDVRGNPLIFIPPEVLRMKGDTITRGYGFIPFYEERLSIPTSALGKLYQCFVRPTDQYDEEKIRAAVDALSPTEKEWLFLAIYEEGGQQVKEGKQWGKDHAFDNLVTLARAVKKTIGLAYQSLPRNQFEKVTRACCDPAVQWIDLEGWNSCLADAVEYAAAHPHNQSYLWPVDRRYTHFLQGIDDLQRKLQWLIADGNIVAWQQNMNVLLKWRSLSTMRERLWGLPGISPHAAGIMEEAYESLRIRFSEVMKEKAAAAACRDIFLKAWKAGGSPNTELGSTEEKIDFGIRALTFDPAVLEQVIKAQLREKLESLSQDQKDAIYRGIYNKGIGVPPYEKQIWHPLMYGRQHVLDDPALLLTLMVTTS